MYKKFPFKKWIFYFCACLFYLVFNVSAFAGISIDSPGDGATVGGIVPITVSAASSDVYPIYYLGCSTNPGGFYLAVPAASVTHTWQWDSTYYPDGGPVTIAAVALPIAGPIGSYTTEINVNVYNPRPFISITSPTDGAYISPDTTNLSVTAQFHNS